MRRPDRPEVGHARAGIDVERLVDCHVHPPLRGVRVKTGWQSHSLSERSRRRVGDLGAWLARRQRRLGSAGSDAADAAAAWLTACFAVRRCGAHSPSHCGAGWTVIQDTRTSPR
eukprot:scaffold78784_cov82-Phaeocystis_antarctica.AAC.2